MTWPLVTVIAAIDHDAFGMGIGGDITVVVLDQDEIAVALQLVAGIADRSGCRGVDRCADAVLRC